MTKNLGSPLRLLLVVLALVAFACGSESDVTATTAAEDPVAESDAAESDTSGDGATESDPVADAGPAPEASVNVVAGSTDDINGGKPDDIAPGDDVPLALSITDLVEGDGNAAQAGDLLVMHYVGVLQDGSQFDASWDRGDTFSFPLGQGRVIQGWDEGIIGMQEGGRRILAIPPEQAYGAQSPSPDIPPNSPLYFVVDLVAAITPPDVENEAAPATELGVTVLEEGDGDTVAVGDVVEVHFTALIQETGEEIASTFLTGQPAIFEVGVEPTQFLAGFDEALPGNNVGSWLRVIVPPELGLPDAEDNGLPPEPTIVTELFISRIR